MIEIDARRPGRHVQYFDNFEDGVVVVQRVRPALYVDLTIERIVEGGPVELHLLDLYVLLRKSDNHDAAAQVLHLDALYDDGDLALDGLLHRLRALCDRDAS